MKLLESFVVGPAVFGILVLLASVFYHAANGWEWSTAVFFSAQTLLGCNYTGPRESRVSQFFTLSLYILGTSLIAGAVSLFAANMAQRAKHIFHQGSDVPRESIWNSNRAVLVCVAAWCGVGMLWGVWYERLSFLDAFYLAIAAMSARGDPDPAMLCTSDELDGCNLGLFRSSFYFVYCIIGVNLYLLFMSNFAGVLCDRAVRAHERTVMSRPLAESEFRYALNLRKNSSVSMSSSRNSLADQLLDSVADSPVDKTPTAPSPKHREAALDLRDFIILELLRLERVDHGFIEDIKEVFNSIDADGNGMLEASDIIGYHDKYFGTSVASATGGDEDDEEDDEEEKDERAAAYNRHFLPLLSASTSKRRRRKRESQSSSSSSYATQTADRILASPATPSKDGVAKKND